jgi:hypothetical protein
MQLQKNKTKICNGKFDLKNTKSLIISHQNVQWSHLFELHQKLCNQIMVKFKIQNGDPTKTK